MLLECFNYAKCVGHNGNRHVCRETDRQSGRNLGVARLVASMWQVGEKAILFCWQNVLLFVLSFLSRPAIFVWGRTFSQFESIFFMPFILFFVRMLDIFHSITNEWAKFDTKDMFFFYFFSHASPTSTT